MTEILKKPRESNRRTRDLIIVFVSWLLLTITTAAIVGLNTWITYQPFLTGGVETEGRVIAKELDNHLQVRFSYKVGSNTYTGIGRTGCGNPTFDLLNVNDPVLVTYDATNPSSALLGDPHCWLTGDLPFIVGVSLAVPVFIIVVLIIRGILPRV